jgi:hypothetical protein
LRFSNKIFTNNSIFQDKSNGMFKSFWKFCFFEEMEIFTFKHGLTWSSFDAHILDITPPGNLIWPVSKSSRTFRLVYRNLGIKKKFFLIFKGIVRKFFGSCLKTLS